MFGAFWQGKVPKVPQHFEPGSALAHDVDAVDGDFCFCYLPSFSGSQGSHHHFTPAADLPLAQMTFDEDEEGGVALAIGEHFMRISYCKGQKGFVSCHSCDSCFGSLEEVNEVQVAGVPYLPKGGDCVLENLDIEKTEIWALEASGTAEGAGQGRVSEIESEQTRLTSLTSECTHPWVAPAAPFNLFRAAPVYLVPAHLTVKAAV